MHSHPQPNNDPTAEAEKRFAMSLSLWVGMGMLLIKTIAYWLTDSSAILSDAAESVVHVAAVAFAAYSLRLTRRPPDQQHRFGYDKIGFISVGFEGAMILLAALFIIYESIQEWITGLHVQNLDVGLLLTALALGINSFLGFFLVKTGEKRKSIILEANGKHVLTDAWTSFGVIVGVALTWFTGWLPFDPICAILVASNILVSGINLLRRSVSGLLDSADPEVEKQIREILAEAKTELGINYHDVRHHSTGSGQRVEMHLLFDDDLSIADAHRIATEIEDRIQEKIQQPTRIITHLEPKRDHAKMHHHPI